MREVVTPVVNSEDIVHYDWHLSGIVRVNVAVGYMNEGVFTALPFQNYLHYEVMGEDYDNLLAATDTKPAGVFRKDDLWVAIDAIRQREATKAAGEQGVVI